MACQTDEAHHNGEVRRVIVLGPGGAAKSTLARELGARLDLPVVELDTVFWSADLEPTPIAQWQVRQRALAGEPTWIMDGDLGPYDDLAPRLEWADTVVILDFPRWRCAWRSLRRSRQRMDYWRWLWRWPTESRPKLLAEIARYAPDATLTVLRRPRAVERWLAEVGPP
jgi:adenylate kinase family enzyme